MSRPVPYRPRGALGFERPAPLPDVLPFGQTRVLLALVVIYQRDGRATVRQVARLANRSVSTTHFHLVALLRAGLVVWTDGQDGTLRPLVEIVACNP